MKDREAERIEVTLRLAKMGHSREWLAKHPQRDQTLIAVVPGDTVGYVLRLLDEADGQAWLGMITDGDLRIVELSIEHVPGWTP